MFLITDRVFRVMPDGSIAELDFDLEENDTARIECWPSHFSYYEGHGICIVEVRGHETDELGIYDVIYPLKDVYKMSVSDRPETEAFRGVSFN